MTKDETPLGYLHEITEPWGAGPIPMYSASADNPWSHWTEQHKDRCQYKCTPLYARPAVEPGADGYKDAFYQIAELLDLPAMPVSPKQAFETVMFPRLRELVADHPDTERLDWVLHNVSGAEWYRIGIIYDAGMTRDDLDKWLSLNRGEERG